MRTGISTNDPTEESIEIMHLWQTKHNMKAFNFAFSVIQRIQVGPY